MAYLPLRELEKGLLAIRASPADNGRVALIVRRPAVDEREILAEAILDPACGLVGDTWPERRSIRTPDGSPHPDMQLNVMNARVAALVAGPEPAPADPTGGPRADPTARPAPVALDRRALAGDQLYLDLDLSYANLPGGTRLQIGSAVIEVTTQSHLGCAKFSARFGPDALRFVNSPTGRELRLRGLNARVVVAGTVRPGDLVTKLAAEAQRSS